MKLLGVCVWLGVVPPSLLLAGNTFFGLAVGVACFVAGLIPGYWGYFSWIRDAELGRPQPAVVYANPHGDTI